jgi:ABC-type transport system involved in Fe-S cluster assembly fused permease/ATPase subunit
VSYSLPSIFNALFRMYPLISGAIKMDEIDIANYPLSSFREALSVIPQFPVLFMGMEIFGHFFPDFKVRFEIILIH